MNVITCDRCGHVLDGRSHPSARRIILTRKLGALPAKANLVMVTEVIDLSRPEAQIDLCQVCTRDLVYANNHSKQPLDI